MNFNKFQILEFQLSSMVKDPAIVMIARRGSGKSFITRDIMYHLRKIPVGCVIAPTDRMNSFYRYFFPDLYIHYEIKDIILKKILSRQSQIIDHEKEAKKNKQPSVDPSAILVMDDCLADKGSWEKDPSIAEILMNGRHYRLTYILTMQTPLGISPSLRLNFDYVYLLNEDSAINKKKLWMNYGSMIPTLALFEKVFSKCTEDYRAMVINNRFPSNDIQKKIFWFKAKERKFTFGSKEFKYLHKKYYDPDYRRNSIGGQDLGLTKRKRNEPDIGIVLK